MGRFRRIAMWIVVVLALATISGCGDDDAASDGRDEEPTGAAMPDSDRSQATAETDALHSLGVAESMPLATITSFSTAALGTFVELSDPVALLDIAAAGPTVVAVGYREPSLEECGSGVVLLSADRGKNWRLIDLPQPERGCGYPDSVGVDGGTIVVAGRAASDEFDREPYLALWHSPDSGTTWESIEQTEQVPVDPLEPFADYGATKLDIGADVVSVLSIASRASTFVELDRASAQIVEVIAAEPALPVHLEGRRLLLSPYSVSPGEEARPLRISNDGGRSSTEVVLDRKVRAGQAVNTGQGLALLAADPLEGFPTITVYVNAGSEFEAIGQLSGQAAAEVGELAAAAPNGTVVMVHHEVDAAPGVFLSKDLLNWVAVALAGVEDETDMVIGGAACSETDTCFVIASTSILSGVWAIGT